jgi:DNA-binding NarL/FixJ family response regulator
VEENMPYGVGILEDNPDFAAYLIGVIKLDPELELAFHVERVQESLKFLAAGNLPDLLLVDMQLPDGSGLDLIAAASHYPQIRILVLTVLADRASVLTALELGAHGYLLKDAPPKQIQKAMWSVLSGDIVLAKQAAYHAVGALRRAQIVPSGSHGSEPSQRESEIIRLLAKGLTYTEIASVLGLSVHTVGDYIKGIYKKLGTTSRGEAVFEARALGWLRMID